MTHRTSLPIVLAITGASGVVYAIRTLQWLLEDQRKVLLVVSPDGETVIRQELGIDAPAQASGWTDVFRKARELVSSVGKSTEAELDIVADAIRNGALRQFEYKDYFSPIASGSFRTAGMVICPCSGASLASIAHATGTNLIHRAAEVHLKERRKLVVVPRETPLSSIQLENMLRLSNAGAVVLPAAPGWYHGVTGLSDLIDFIAGRILDQLDIPHSRVKRWQA